jgi:ribosomal protein L27
MKIKHLSGKEKEKEKKQKTRYSNTEDSETKEYVNKSKKRKQIIEYGSILVQQGKTVY